MTAVADRAGAPPEHRRWLRLLLFALAVLGGLAGLFVFFLHATGDPLNDVHAYYLAGQRLNQGVTIYPPDVDTSGPLWYPYPPLLAILFRPLALLPFEVAAAIWEALVVASFAATIWWIGPRRPETWLAIGILGLPIAWCLAIGQAQVPLTLFTALGAPWSIALAANLKLFPALIALWWIGRREWRRLGQFAAAMGVLLAVQLVLAPQACLDYLGALGLHWVGEVRNISPYAVSPLLWGVLAVAGTLAVLRLAPTRYGWAAAVALSVLVNPRLLVYQLMTLLATLSTPGRRHTDDGPRPAGTLPGSGDAA